MDRHVKTGILFMSMWVLFIVLLFGIYMYITDTPFSYFLDEETGGFISAGFFLAWALIWYGIGRHFSRDYEIKKNIFINNCQGVDGRIASEAFRKSYFSKTSRMLSIVFFVSVPFYVAANVKDTVTLKNAIYIGILMAFSIIFYAYNKKNNIKDITL